MPSGDSTFDDIRQGFVYERIPHITLKSIANNAEIDVIWEKFQEKLEPLQQDLNAVLGTAWEEWGDSPGYRGDMDGRGEETPRPLVGGTHRPSEGNRRLYRRQGGLRISLRQAQSGQQQGARGRPFHGREPLAAPRARRGRER